MSPEPTRRRARIIGLCAFFVPAFAPSAPALAQQTGGALDRFDPAPVGDPFFSLPSADVAGRLRFAASAEISYAHDPLVLRQIPSGTVLDWVSDQGVLHVQLGVEVWKRLKLDLDVPALLADGGTSGEIGGQQVTAPSGAHIGDLRIAARGALLHQRGFVPAAGISLSVWAPTGSTVSFAGAGVARFQPGIVLGAEHRHLVWSASLGARFQPHTTNGVVGSQIVGGVGVAARFFGVTLGPELFYGASANDARAAIFSGSSGGNAELLVGARYRLGPLGFGLAAGPGLGRGPGTPAYRLIAGVSGTLDALSPDADEDGDASSRLASPVTPPAPTAPPPPLDTDGDGVPDAEDACPTIVGDATPGAYRRGCPADRDRDGIPDTDDACPDVPGVPSNDPEKNGCPLDTDGDGIPDDKDACPKEKGPPNQDPKLNGCPVGSAVRIEGSQIIILQQVNFDTGKATITKDSFTILSQVAALLEGHPDIARVTVDGHTDNRGGDAPNKALSEKRALAVVLWLTEHGVDARRLEARGFGMRRPIAANVTSMGRAKNRRVEFLIRRFTNLGKAGWIDGPITDDPPPPPKAATPP
jgi:outer membrane protein OmpA-like peptidoglycan-associated protein